MGKQYTVAVVGAGDMGGQHVVGWTLAGHRVATIADVDEPRARELAAAHGVPNVVRDLSDVLADPAIDIVSLCVPLALHAPMTIAAAGAGKHVFCEKPLARDFAEARAMEAAVTEAGVQFGIGFQRNLAPGVELLAGRAREGRFGRPLVFNSEAIAEVRPKRVMHDRYGNNGPIMDNGCHLYLLWQTVFDSVPVRVYAQGRILARDRPELAHFKELAIDTAIVTVEYASGDLATLTTSWGLAANQKMRPRPDRVFGPQGGAEGTVNGDLTLYTGETVENIALTPENLHAKEFTRFARSLDEGGAHHSGFREGKEMLALTLAIFRSIETGQPEPVSYDF